MYIYNFFIFNQEFFIYRYDLLVLNVILCREFVFIYLFIIIHYV